MRALCSRGPSGPVPRLSDAQLARVEQALLEGATANGFMGELWTLDRIGVVVERLTGVRHHPGHVWALLRYRLGWTVQRPRRRAAERNQDAIDRWVKECWPRIKQTVSVGLRSGRIAVRLRRRHRGMTPKQTGTEVAFGRAVCRGAGVDLATACWLDQQPVRPQGVVTRHSSAARCFLPGRHRPRPSPEGSPSHVHVGSARGWRHRRR